MVLGCRLSGCKLAFCVLRFTFCVLRFAFNAARGSGSSRGTAVDGCMSAGQGPHSHDVKSESALISAGQRKYRQRLTCPKKATLASPHESISLLEWTSSVTYGSGRKIVERHQKWSPQAPSGHAGVAQSASTKLACVGVRDFVGFFQGIRPSPPRVPCLHSPCLLLSPLTAKP